MALKTRATFLSTPGDLAARDRARRNIVPGDHVKVVVKSPAGREAFWVRVTKNERRGGPWQGSVANKLLLSDGHGLKFGDKITVKPSKIWGVAWGEDRKPYPDDKRAANPVCWECSRKANPCGKDGPQPHFRKRKNAEPEAPAKDRAYNPEKRGTYRGVAWVVHKYDSDCPQGLCYFAEIPKARYFSIEKRTLKAAIADAKGIIDRNAEALGAKAKKQAKAKNPSGFRGKRADDGKGWETIKRAPLSLRGVQLAELGHVLEVEAGPYLFKWKNERLLWDPHHRALVILQGAKVGASKRANRKGAAANAYGKFMGRGVSSARVAKMPALKGTWRKAKPVRRVDYRSDKFGRGATEYTHKHGSGVALYRAGGSEPPWVWVIRGGNLRVTARGIEG